MPLADEPISEKRLKEIMAENVFADLDKPEMCGVPLKSIAHPDCRMTRMTEIAHDLWDKIVGDNLPFDDFDGFEKAFHAAAHEYAVEADWLEEEAERAARIYQDPDRVELKKWAFEQASAWAAGEGAIAAMERADELLAWLEKP